MIRRNFIIIIVLLIAKPGFAQEPLQPYDARGRYRTGGFEVQLTGAFGGGRDLMLSWGALAVGGRGGRWMQRTELVAGIHAGENLVDRLLVGPQVSLALAVPGWYTELDHATRAEPYLVLGGGAYGVADFADEEAELGISPSISAGIGFRVFEDEWDVALTHVEVVLQQRFGVADQAPQVYLRFSRATPRTRRATSTPHPDAPGGVPPAPRRR
ncbi:MAG TPA: hypothetical protein VFR37_18485 [Longimicrobium sp.]|nr:hypothetical protein [Longimicrobium sp.]